MKTFLNSSSLRSIIILIILIHVCTIAFAGGGGKLDFKNSTLQSGTAGANGAVYKFPDVGNNVDALVTIKDRSDALVYLVTVDMVTSGFDKAWQPQVGYNNGSAPGAADWWMEFEMSFVKKGTNTPATVEEFDLSAIDIDGNGHLIREYVSFYGLNSYVLETNSVLGMTKLTGLLNGLTSVLGTRFDGPTVNFLNIDTSGTAVMVTTNYQNVQKFSVRVGGVSSGPSGASERMYSLYFQSFTYAQPTMAMLPVTLKSFDTKLNNSNVLLDWTTGTEVSFSHFIIERSTNGIDYSELAVVFGDINAGNNAYAYTDAVNTNAAGLIYYRLKMVDRDGTSKFSNVRIVKLNAKNGLVTVSTYPNPVTNELRITIPANWQNKQVTYEMINLSGVVVKQQINQHASQTETLMVNNLQSGNYVIRMKAGSESAVQMIVKN